MIKRLLSNMLALSMIVSLMPSSVLAMEMTQIHVQDILNEKAEDENSILPEDEQSSLQEELHADNKLTLSEELNDTTSISINDAEDIYKLARILQFRYNDDSYIDEELKADYLHFGYENSFAAAYDELKSAEYKLNANIKLSNENGFSGIPNFSGSFDGMNHTITLSIDFSNYTSSSQSNDFFGGVFKSIEGAEIKNIKLSGQAEGILKLNANLTDIGLLIGGIKNVAVISTIENISSDAVINLNLDNNNKTAYIGAVIGRTAPANVVTLASCINSGDFIIENINANGNASRIGGLIGHSGSGTNLIDCLNEGDIKVTGAAFNAGDLQGTSNGTNYVNCSSKGNVEVQAGSLNIFAGMSKNNDLSNANNIYVTIQGSQGDRVQLPDGEEIIFETDCKKNVKLSVYTDTEGIRNYEKYNIDEFIMVNGSKRLYLFNLGNKIFKTELNIADADESALPFHSWDTAIILSTEEHFLWLQRAINDGDEQAIRSLYVLGNEDVENIGLENGQLILRSSYYKLVNDVTINNSEFTGIGDNDYFGGHFDGNNHKISLTIDQNVDVINENTHYGLFGFMAPLADGVVEIRNLTVESKINLVLPAVINQTVYVGGLGGQAKNLTLSNVSLVTNGISVTRQTTGESLSGSLNLGGMFGLEIGRKGNDLTITLSDTITVDWNKHNGEVLAGGYAGNCQAGTNVTFIGGNGIQVINKSNAKVGGIGGYSWSQNDFIDCKLLNLTDHTISIVSENGYVGALLGYSTFSSATADQTVIRAERVSVEGDFLLKGKVAGGLIGFADTPGSILVKDSIINDNIKIELDNISYTGGILGQVTGNALVRLENTLINADKAVGGILIGTVSKGHLSSSESAYIKKDSQQKPINKGNLDVSNLTLIDVSKLANQYSYGDQIEILTGNKPQLLSVIPADIAEFANDQLMFTKLGINSITFMWQGIPVYTTVPITVTAKALTSDDITIAGINDQYATDEAAAASSIHVLAEGKLLIKDVDYEIEQNIEEHKFIIRFMGNYSGSEEAAYIINEAAKIEAINYTGVYDGFKHGISIQTPEGSVVKYSETESDYDSDEILVKDVGNKVVYWQVTVDHDNVISGSSVISITPASLTILPDDHVINIGGILPEFTYSVMGWQNEEGTFITEPELICEAADSSKSGIYAIKAQNADAGKNYKIIYFKGTLTISERNVSGFVSTGSSVKAETAEGKRILVKEVNPSESVLALLPKASILTVLQFTNENETMITYHCGRQIADKTIYALQINEFGMPVLAASAEADRYGTVMFKVQSSGQLILVTELPIGFIITAGSKPITYYVQETGRFKNGWLLLEKEWYFFDYETAAMAVNQWIPSNKDWYKFDSSGKMITSSWIAQDASGSIWYYVDAEGAMVRNNVIDGYPINADGIWHS